MAASSRGFAAQFDFKLGGGGRRGIVVGDVFPAAHGLGLEVRKRWWWRRRVRERDRVVGACRISCCCSDPVVPIRRANGPVKRVEKREEWRFDPKRRPHRARIQASPSTPFASSQYVPIFAYMCVCVSLVH
jgi:hypothetical protein